MAIFSKSSSYDLDPAYEAYGIEVGGGTDALIEGFSDELAVIEAMHAYDMAEIEMMKKVKAIKESASDEEDEEEKVKEAEEEFEEVAEASVKEIWEKIRAWFKSLWEKIRAFFASIVRFFAAAFLSPKAFVKKYKTQLSSLKNVNFKYTTYPYPCVDSVSTDVDAIKATAKLFDEMKKSCDEAAKELYEDSMTGVKATMGSDKATKLQAIMEEMEKTGEALRNDVMKECVGKVVDSSEFADACYEAHRGAKEPKEITITKVDKWVNFIEKSDKLISEIKKAESNINGYYKSFNDAIEKYASKAQGYNTTAGAKVAAVVRKAGGAMMSTQSLYNTYVSIATKVTKEAANVGKAICAKALNPKSSKKDANY